MASGLWSRIKQLVTGSSVIANEPSTSVEIDRPDWEGAPAIISENLKGKLDYVQCISTSGLHKMAYRTWGNPNNPKVLLCVHGLTRRGSDFEELALAMSDRYRVVCPDVVGRGDSDFLSNPLLYGVPQYVSDMVALVARLNPTQLDWFGTSMGGLIGMVYGGLKNCPIHRLLLNDVGPKIDPAFLVRLMTYLGKPVKFATQAEGLAYLNQLTETFGKFTPEQAAKYNSPHLIQKEGVWTLHYDLAISAPLMTATPASAAAGEMALWKSYEAISAPTLIVRGAESDLLSRNTVEEMCKRNPKARAVEIPDCGHAPAFIVPEQIEIARNFFE